MSLDSKPPTVRSLDRSNLRLSAETIAGIDATRAARPGNISRNTWITEAIEEKLARDAVGAAFQQSGSRRAHG
jgi:predicted HicB family RNase H-like nuclease